jgi:hypothetical protein
VLRVDRSTHRILTITYKEETHRYAVPLHYTVGLAADRAVDSMTKPRPDRSNERKPNQMFTLAVNERVVAPDQPLGAIDEGNYVTVIPLENT